MALIFNKFLTSRDFLINFKNVIKLKDNLFRPFYHRVGYSSFNLQINSPAKMTKNFIKLNYSPFLRVRSMSRWMKCSSSGIPVTQSPKKKNKKSDVFAENVKLKFQSARRETRRKVQKKIVEIKENVLTIPNGLCVLRIAATPFLGYLVLSEFYTTSLGIFIFAGFTDMIDGYIARNFPNQQSMIGSFLDPAADKLLIATLFITLTANGLIPVPLTSLIIIRDALLMGAGFYIRYVSLPPPRTLTRYFDMSFVTAKLSPTGISKANTLIQLSLVAASLAAPVFSFVDHFYLHILWYVTGSSTVLSAASYLYYKNTFKLLTSGIPKEK